MDAPSPGQDTGGYSWGLRACGACMEGRQARTWCCQCHAPELWAENLPSVRLWLACETQQRYAPLSAAPLGLDYNAVAVVMRLHQIPKARRPGLFADLQAMEREYLTICREPRAAP